MVKKKKLLNIEFSNQLICTWSEDQTRIGVILFHSSTKLFATLNELKFENLLALWKEFRKSCIWINWASLKILYKVHSDWRKTNPVNRYVSLPFSFNDRCRQWYFDFSFVYRGQFYFPFSIWAEWTNRSAFCEAIVHKSNTRK